MKPPLPPTRIVTLEMDGASIPFAVADGEGPVFVSMGIRKSGSTMLHRIVNFLAAQNGINLVDVPGTFFRRGFTVRHWEGLDLSAAVRPGNLYTGFRSFPANLAALPAFATARKVFMFRDPRDALVSQYFSDAYSHSLPQAGAGHAQFLAKREEALASEIDAWVLDKADAMRRTVAAYRPMLSDPTTLVLRYEEHVFQKRRMVRKILAHFGWTLGPEALDRLMGDVDVVPDAEDKTRFIRRAVPGDHQAKLTAETVRRLNHRLADVLAAYDY